MEIKKAYGKKAMQHHDDDDMVTLIEISLDCAIFKYISLMDRKQPVIGRTTLNAYRVVHL